MHERSTSLDGPALLDADVPLSRRAAKKEETRRRLVAAAADVIAERGFHGASLMEIATRAGLTTGAVYSNFRSKEDLFLAVIQATALPLDLVDDTRPLWQRLGETIGAAMGDVDRPDARRLMKLQLEFALLTVQDPALRQRFAVDLHSDDMALAALLAGAEPAPPPDFAPTAEQLATVLIAAMQGLQQHRFVDQEAVSEELAAWMVQALLHVAQGRLKS
jgi:AcrR family transcriptional regulator